MYPLMFDPIYKEMLWGGSSLRDCFGRDIPSEKTGESWDISCRADAMGIIKNGIYTGRRFICFENAPEYFAVASERIRRELEGGGDGAV